MKITTVKPLSECEVTSHRTDRTDYADAFKRDIKRLENYPSDTAFGIGPFTTRRAVIVNKSKPEAEKWARRDIGCLTFKMDGHHLFNVFVNPDGSHGGPNGKADRIELDDADVAFINDKIAEWFAVNADFVKRQQRWYAERPWDAIEAGMTCQQAIDILTAAGWGVGDVR